MFDEKGLGGVGSPMRQPDWLVRAVHLALTRGNLELLRMDHITKPHNFNWLSSTIIEINFVDLVFLRHVLYFFQIRCIRI